MSNLGMNGYAQFCSARPLGMESEFVEDRDQGLQTAGSSKGSRQNGHVHHWRLWQPGVHNDLHFFEGSMREMQSVVMTPGSSLSVRRFGNDARRFFVDNRQVASVTYSGRRYTIAAHEAGETLLHAENSKGKCISALFIHVRQLATLPVMFLFLKDSSEKLAHGYWSHRDAITQKINEIYMPQLAVQVVDRTPNDWRTKPVVIDMDLGDPINLSLLNSATFHLKVLQALPSAASGPTPKFIFVREFNDTTVQGMQKNEHLYIRDGIEPKRVGRVCAHELAHMLTSEIKNKFDQAGHTSERSHLLNDVADGIRLDPFSLSYAMYCRALEVGGKTV